MSKRDLLIEIGLEEMPARFVKSSMEQFAEKMKNWLDEMNISYETIKPFSTPRRLAVLIANVHETQPDKEEEMKGPAKKIALDQDGNWSKAAIGFSKSNGKNVDDIYFKEIKGIEYAFVKKFIQGRKTVDILQENLEEIILSLSFPKNMRWSNLDIRYVRPIKWLVVLYGEEVIPVTVANVNSGNETYGHRFLGEKISLTHAKDYENQLLGQYVLADSNRRKEAILSQLSYLASDQKWEIPVDEQLLEEVNNLVEYPTVLSGGFKEEFLQLPEGVLITSMKEHQRYFPVKNKEGKLLPHFVTVRNGDHRNIEIVQKGNEKVLHARLQDAVFFYEEDLKLSIEMAMNKLKRVVYHEELGTFEDKTNRIKSLTEFICQELQVDEKTMKNALRTAEICKFDLVTQMVYEFPELQGYMGEKYALKHGENADVAKGIREHYMPRHADDDLPTSEIGAIVSIADKLDTLVSFFAIGNIPSGSQDPYALRRQTLGIVQIMIDNGWNIDLEKVLDKAINLVSINAKQNMNELKEQLLSFIKLRFKYILQERDIRHDLIDAVLAAPISNPSSVINRADVLQKEKDRPDFKEDIEALSRVINISQKASTIVEVQPELFENEYEHTLFEKYQTMANRLKDITDEQQRFSEMVELKSFINQYFDHTMVMAEVEQVRINRLSFMKELAQLFLQFAKFNEIIVK